ncbi:MAG: beta-propeller fold lactonase family protein, partial [Lachnospiraceae bacterium]|nr:beta-propeller fold lactonase family protein [Lachnospiraceae bacterium]
GNSKGIENFDVDSEAGRFVRRSEVSVDNCAYLTVSEDRRFLYAAVDEGISSFKILPNGDLEFLKTTSIRGMRGCYLSTDFNDRLLFVAGYHDGKLTVLRLLEDGKIGRITDEIYHKGLGLGFGRANMPHVECCKPTRDNKYICACDSGMDRTIIYRIHHDTGRLTQADIIHAEPGSAPRHVKFSKDGQFMYIVCEQKTKIDIYHYEEINGEPEFEKVGQALTGDEDDPIGTAASALNFSHDFKFLISSDMTTNEVVIFRAHESDGTLSRVLSLPIAGAYPKDAMLFPDNRHLVSLNHESNAMTFFSFHEKNRTLIMNGPEVKVSSPNCIVFHKLT